VLLLKVGGQGLDTMIIGTDFSVQAMHGGFRAELDGDTQGQGSSRARHGELGTGCSMSGVGKTSLGYSDKVQWACHLCRG
jgi:hypothetical protein